MSIRLPNAYKNRLFTFAYFSLDRSTATLLTPNRRNCSEAEVWAMYRSALSHWNDRFDPTEHIFLVDFNNLFSTTFSGDFFPRFSSSFFFFGNYYFYIIVECLPISCKYDFSWRSRIVLHMPKKRQFLSIFSTPFTLEIDDSHMGTRAFLRNIFFLSVRLSSQNQRPFLLNH